MIFRLWPFCIANAVALAKGIDLTRASWDQDRIREQKKFEKQNIEMFPHDVKQTPMKCHYVVRVYCICLKHIPGGFLINMIACVITRIIQKM